MYSRFLLAAFGLAALVSAEPAPLTTDSPTNVKYEAKFERNAQGSVVFSSTNGTVLLDVSLHSLPETNGPFTYWIHDLAVPLDGNCTATGGNFNPYNGVANASTPAEHMLGDLSGKHGIINGTALHAVYSDPYLSLRRGDRAYIGGLSLAIHNANSVRIACANITEEANVVPGGAARLAGAAAGLPLAAGVAALLL